MDSNWPILRLTAERGKNLSAASGVAYIRLGAILTFLAAPNPAPKSRTAEVWLPAIVSTIRAAVTPTGCGSRVAIPARVRGFLFRWHTVLRCAPALPPRPAIRERSASRKALCAPARDHRDILVKPSA